MKFSDGDCDKMKWVTAVCDALAHLYQVVSASLPSSIQYLIMHLSMAFNCSHSLIFDLVLPKRANAFKIVLGVAVAISIGVILSRHHELDI